MAGNSEHDISQRRPRVIKRFIPTGANPDKALTSLKIIATTPGDVERLSKDPSFVEIVPTHEQTEGARNS